jgi:hypothetical protein
LLHAALLLRWRLAARLAQCLDLVCFGVQF